MTTHTSLDEAMQALRAADKAGNVEDARQLAGIVSKLQQSPVIENKPISGEDVFRTIGQFGRSMVQGALSYGGDEAAAGAGSIIGGGTYEEELAYQRAQQEKIPAKIAIPGEMLGAAATSIPLVKGAAWATQGVKALSNIPRWLKTAGIGGAYGGAAGFGASEGGFGPRMRGAGRGAALGATTGALLHVGVKAVQYGARKVGEAFRSRKMPELEAWAKIREAFERDGMTPDKIRTRLRELGPQATLADAGGRNVRALGGEAARTPGPGQNRIEVMLNQRTEGEGARILQALKKGLDPEDFYTAQEQFVNNLKTRAKPFYEKAYEKYQSLTSPRLELILKHPDGQKALKEAANLIGRERAAGESGAFLGAIDAELTAVARAAADVGKMGGVGQPGVTAGLSLRTWDQIKRGFDAMLEQPKFHKNDIPGSPLNQAGRSVYLMQKKLRSELDRLTTPTRHPKGQARTSDYAKARTIYAGDMEVIDALAAGRNMMKMDPEQITKYMVGLSDAGKQAFRSGGARIIMDNVNRTRDALTATNRIFANNTQRAQIKAMFPDNPSYVEFRRAMVAEQQFAKTRNEALAGSQTEARQVQRRDMFTRVGEMLGIMSAGAGPGHTLLKAGVFKQAGNRFVNALLGDNTSAYHLATAKTLFGRNQAMNQQSLDTLFDPTVWKAIPSVAREQLIRALLAGTTQQTGQAVAVKGVAADRL